MYFPHLLVRLLNALTLPIWSRFPLSEPGALADPIGTDTETNAVNRVCHAEAGAQSRSTLNVFPRPRSPSSHAETPPVCLANNFTIELDDLSGPGAQSTPSDDLNLAIARTLSRVKEGRMEFLSVRGGREFFDPPRHRRSPSAVQVGERRGEAQAANRVCDKSGPQLEDTERDQDKGEYEVVEEEDEEVGECRWYLDRLVVSMTAHDGSTIFDQATAPITSRPSLEAYSLDIPGDLDGARPQSTHAHNHATEERRHSIDHEDGLPTHAESRPRFVQGTLVAPGPLGVLRGLTTFEQIWYYLPPEGRTHARTHHSHRRSEPQKCESTWLRTDRATDLRGEHAPPVITDKNDGEAYRGAPTQATQVKTAHGHGVRYAPFPPYRIEDKPVFGWRGLLLDTSRHYFGVGIIKRTLDTMSMVKLNVFQWHITDSNSFPLLLRDHPELAEEGAYSPAEVYTEDDVEEIVRYAGERGIDVVLELDTPGHAASIAPSHPSFVACYERTPWATYAHQPPAGQLRFASDAVANWTAGLFGSVARLSKSQYLSTGGDEVNERCMLEDEPTMAALKEKGWTLDQALDGFTNTTHSTLRGNGKTPVVWQEMVLDHGHLPSLKNDTIVQVWVDSSDVKRVLKKGYRIVHAAADYLYLDCGQGAWIGKPGGGRSWCDPFKTWSRIYSFDPYRDVSEEDGHLILGGQVSLWTEQTDEANLDAVLWPRAAAAAEVFWSGPGNAHEALARMHEIRYRMLRDGVGATPLQPHWCALRPGQCNEEA